MAETKQVKMVVNHPKLYLTVKGAKQHVPMGSTVTVTEDQAERLDNKLLTAKEAKAVQVDAPKADAPPPPAK